MFNEDNVTNFNSFFEKYLRNVIMSCFKNIININKTDFNYAFNYYKNELKLSTLENFTDFTKKVDTFIQNINDNYKKNTLTTIIIQILEIIKVLCCYNLYKKFLDISILIKNNFDKTTDTDKILKYININIFVDINTIFNDSISQQFTSWWYGIKFKDEKTFIDKISEMHHKVVTDSNIKNEINKTVTPL